MNAYFSFADYSTMEMVLLKFMLRISMLLSYVWINNNWSKFYHDCFLICFVIKLVYLCQFFIAGFSFYKYTCLTFCRLCVGIAFWSGREFQIISQKRIFYFILQLLKDFFYFQHKPLNTFFYYFDANYRYTNSKGMKLKLVNLNCCTNKK